MGMDKGSHEILCPKTPLSKTEMQRLTYKCTYCKDH